MLFAYNIVNKNKMLKNSHNFQDFTYYIAYTVVSVEVIGRSAIYIYVCRYIHWRNYGMQ